MVLLLYTSHNSPSHQSRAIFYRGDDISIRGCQTLTAALWVVALEESIVNKHNINRISLAGARHGSSSDDCSARTHTGAGAETHLSLSPSPVSLSVVLMHKHKNSQIWQSQTTEMQDKRQKLAKGSVPVSASSPVSTFHQRYEGPIRVRSQSGNTLGPKTQNWGSFKDWSLMAPFLLCYCLHLFCLSSQQTLAVKPCFFSASFKVVGCRQSWGTFCSLQNFKARVCARPRWRWLCLVCVGRQRHTRPSHSWSFN